MSSNITRSDVAVRLGTTIDDADVTTFQSLTADTLNVIGTSQKGKAFVPQNIVNPGTQTRIKPDGTSEELEIYNTVDNILGQERAQRFRHLNDSYSCYADSTAYDALSIWLEGNKEQATFTRILGIGTGKKTSKGTYINSGFNLENNISRGSSDNLTKTRNPQARENGVSGNVSFLLNRKNSLYPNYLEDLGITNAANSYFIDTVIFSADGILPSIINQLDVSQHTISEVASDYSDQVKKQILNSAVSLELLGLDSVEDNRNIINSDTSSLNVKKVETYQSTLIDSLPNYWPDRFLNRGHLIYAQYSSAGLLGKVEDTCLITSRNYSTLDDSLPDYNSFETKYQTAKTPWITSQPVNRQGINDNRENLQDKVIDLFRFHSLDDGEIGNRFRIKINIKKRGNYLANIYASFEIYIFEYDPRDNSYLQIDHQDLVDLNPDSKFYIGRIFGDENTYYDIESKKVVTEVKYERRSKYLRVEIHEDVEEKVISPTILPVGFRAYPHIRINKSAFSDYSNEIQTKDIYQMPVIYSPNYYSDTATGGSHYIRNNWGVIFTPSQLNGQNKIVPITPADINNEFYSPHYYQTKFFMSGLTEETRDIWVQDDSYLNSFFNLEKIYYNIDDINNVNAELNLYYTRKGSAAGGGEIKNYINFDDNSFWDDNDTLINSLENNLSFDFYTYGGFDGVDIRDQDKRFLNNNAVVRENNGEDANISLLNSPTINSYIKGIEIATSEVLSSDILVLPGISNSFLTRKCIDICEDKKTMIHISDVSTMTNDIIQDVFEVKNIVSNYQIDDEKFGSLFQNTMRLFLFAKELEQNFEEIKQTVTSLGLESKYYFPVFGILMGAKGIQQKYLDSTLFAIKKSSNAINLNPAASFNREVLNGYSISNLSRILNYRDEDWDRNTEDFRKNKLNVIYSNAEHTVSLYSQNTSYDTRGEIYSLFNNIRAINNVKKEIKFNLLTEPFANDFSPILFSQNASINSVYTRLDTQLRSKLEELKSNNLIFNYGLRVNSELDDKTLLDAQNYILRGTIFLSLNANENFDIIRLSIEDILNEVSLLSNENSIDLVENYI